MFTHPPMVHRLGLQTIVRGEVFLSTLDWVYLQFTFGNRLCRASVLDQAVAPVPRCLAQN